MRFEREELPTGRVIVRYYSDDGLLTRESHSYAPRIGITYNFVDGKPDAEVYVVNGKPASLAVYEKYRSGFPDMPAATKERDIARGLKTEVKAGHARWLELFAKHVPDSAVAKRSDEDTQQILKAGVSTVPLAMIDEPKFRLGTLSLAKSRALLRRFASAGAKSISLGNLDPRSGSFGVVVIELPDAGSRRELFSIADEVVRPQGNDGALDDGQRYLPVHVQ